MLLSKSGLTFSVYDFRKQIRDNPTLPVIIAEGDSWFGYPRKNVLRSASSNLVENINDQIEANILRLERNGHLMSQVMEDSDELFSALLEFTPDVLLISGGGNDLAENIDSFVVNGELVSRGLADQMAELKSLYEKLLEVVDQTCRAKIIEHTYDYPIPGDRPAKFFGGLLKFGPWIYPGLVRNGVHDSGKQQYITRQMIDCFSIMLDSLEYDSFTKIDLRGTLKCDEWIDEIHATPTGFRKLSDLFMVAIKEFV